MGLKDVNISHLLSTNDTLVCNGAKPDHLRYLRALFLCFEAVFGLKINLAKSELVPVGNVENVDELADILGYGVSSFPMKYLGLSLGAFFKVKSIWDGVMKKIVTTS
jgi:hypothetical protein